MGYVQGGFRLVPLFRRPLHLEALHSPYKGRFAMKWAGDREHVKGAGRGIGVKGNQHSSMWVVRKMKPGLPQLQWKWLWWMVRSHRPEASLWWAEEGLSIFKSTILMEMSLL